ncbi:alpha/beta hydrolase [Desertibacillus haloalkaliphilus]|uniref:alpha/beta hydrolase n=1 Tax=Desertibacillus haloalkaliphilus TaxID=1328930 RepID=UPI001C276A9F|nr:alpha/beta hydrolase [Desertibacillus haloalkaliphilus]MBU8906251.1 alpha/beta hydrolase [Desertibacillus haloalkaliphilus]
MALQPQVKKLVDQINAATADGPGIPDMSVEENREGLIGFYADIIGERQEVAKVENVKIPVDGDEIGLRLYTPEGNGPFPVLVYYHGGGWVLGDLEVVDPLMRSLANSTECLVVSVDYRLAPENKFPIPVEDCYAATKWVAENISNFNGDPEKIAVSGDSAGGNLAAVVPLMAKDRGGPKISYQILLYPGTDFAFDTKSFEENGEGYYLETSAMHWFADQYFSTEDEKVHPYAAPIRAKDLSGLPPALVFTAEYDVLRDEGENYAKRLQEAGVPVEVKRYDGQIHGFFWMPVLMDDAHDALQRISDTLKKAFS